MPRVSGKRVFANVLGDGLATMWKISLHCTLCFHCRLSLTWSPYRVELGNKPEAQIAVKVLFCWVPWNLDTKLEFAKIFPGFVFCLLHLIYIVLLASLCFWCWVQALWEPAISRNQWLYLWGLLPSSGNAAMSWWLSHGWWSSPWSSSSQPWNK